MQVDIEDRVKKAIDYFTQGYNCSQSVVLAYADILNVDSDLLTTIAAPFGGGMGRLREVCGAVSGMFMVSGFINKAQNSTDLKERKVVYQSVQDLAKKFSDINGSIICRDLLGLKVKSEIATPSERTSEYYKKRPCKELVGIAARITGEMINQKQ